MRGASLLACRRRGTRVEGIGDLPGVGGREGRLLGFVEGILGEVHRVGGVGLGPLGPPLGGICVELVPLLLEPGLHLLELLMDLAQKAGPRRGQLVLHLGAARLDLLAPPLGGGLGLGDTSLEFLAGLLPGGAMWSWACFARCDRPAMDADSLARDSETVGMISSGCDSLAGGAARTLQGRKPLSAQPGVPS